MAIFRSHKTLRLLAVDKSLTLGGKRRRQRRSTTFNLTKEQRIAQLKRNELRRTQLRRACSDEWARQEMAVKDLSVRFRMSEAEIRRRLQRLPKHGPRRRVNAWNAYIHFKSLEINDGE